MAGHSHWAGIKHQKEIADQRRGKVFAKLLAAVTAAARSEPDPDFNPRLRTMIAKAREAKVPQENIERAIARAKDPHGALEELVIEAYGPGGIAVLAEAITDNRNRTIAEVRKIVADRGGKWAEHGSVLWAFEISSEGWRARFPQKISAEDAQQLAALVAALEEHDDLQSVQTNAVFPTIS